MICDSIKKGLFSCYIEDSDLIILDLYIVMSKYLKHEIDKFYSSRFLQGQHDKDGIYNSFERKFFIALHLRPDSCHHIFLEEKMLSKGGGKKNKP